ncbi:MAG: M48 family metalloprotease [Francisellaceae bacterium]|nr:M48 family metalloprotease [Francisellaceae bacterium]
MLTCSSSFASYSSDLKNYNLGTSMYRELQGGGLVDNDMLVNEYMAALSSNLNYSSIGTIHNLNLFVVKDRDLNAFAFFGNNIALHQGLILELNNENELAGVVAHEMAHIHLRHLDRFQEQQQQLLPTSILAIIGALALGAPDLATAAIANHYQKILSFSRHHEQEADRIGMRILASNSFEPHAMSQAFATLQEKNSLNAKAQEFLSTHPIFSSRIADTASRANSYQYVQYANSFLYQIAKARIEISSNDDIKKHVKDLELIYKLQHFNNRDVFEYKLALAYSKANQTSKAYALINALHNRRKNNWVYSLAVAEIYLANAQYDSAYKVLRRLNEEYPDHNPIIFYYGIALEKTKHYGEAIEIFNYLAKILPNRGFIYENIAKADKNLNNNMSMHQNLAKAYVMYQQLDLAIEQLDLALKYADSKAQKTILTKEKEILIAQKKLYS